MPDITPAEPATPAAAAAPPLSYNLPQSVSYSGQGFIELQLDSSWFIASSQNDTGEGTS